MKEIVERASGVPATRQRLLARGRVLSDDSSMESARVEDGDTLLLVTSEPDESGGREDGERSAEAGAASEDGQGEQAGVMGDLSSMITSLLTSNPAMLGAMAGSGGSGALTVEFSIGGPPPGARAVAASQRARGENGGGKPVERGGASAASAQLSPVDTLRRYIHNVERLLRSMQHSEPRAISVGGSEPMPMETPANVNQTETHAPPIHFGVQCDACEINPVRGTRFKSVAHDDFDLCEECFRAGRGAQCGPFARLDLPLPAGLPPVIAHANADDMDENRTTPRQESEEGVATLGTMLSTARQLAHEAGPLIDNIARRYHPDSRENTVETQAQSLQLATLMHSVGALWCELARCIAVVPPPPNAMTPEGAAIAGDDINNARSLFAYPQTSHIASSGAFAHTRPPGMPRHDQDANVPQVGQRNLPNVMHILHHLQGPYGAHDMDSLPAELRAMLMRQASQRAQHAPPQAQTGSQPAVQPTQPATQPTAADAQNAAETRRNEVRDARSSQRALSRLLGSVLRAIPSPSFMTQAGATGATQAGATPPGANASRSSLIQDMYSQIIGSPPRQSQIPEQRNPPVQAHRDRVAPRTVDVPNVSAQDNTPTRARTRSESKQDDTDDRAAKASNTGNGMSPAARAARLVIDERANSAMGQQASTSSDRQGKKEDKE